MADAEFMKEFIRKNWKAGTLDLSGDRADLEGFLRIFQGEMEATIAIDHAIYLSDEEKLELLKIAKPTKESVAHHRAWLNRIHQPQR
jgi:hypothetical protein